MLDPYERKDIIESKEKKISKSKMLPEIFRTMSHGDILFSNPKRTYGLDNYANELLKKKHNFTPSSPVKFIIKVFYRDLPNFPTEHHNERLKVFAYSLNESKTRFHMI